MNMAKTNYDIFNLFDALVIIGADQVVSAKIEKSCSFFCNDIQAGKHIAQTCSTGYLTMEALMSICEFAPGLIKQPEIAGKVISERKMFWPEFVEQLRLDL